MPRELPLRQAELLAHQAQAATDILFHPSLPGVLFTLVNIVDPLPMKINGLATGQ